MLLLPQAETALADAERETSSWKDGDQQQQAKCDQMTAYAQRLTQLVSPLSIQINKLEELIVRLRDIAQQNESDKARAETIITALTEKQQEFKTSVDRIVFFSLFLFNHSHTHIL